VLYFAGATRRTRLFLVATDVSRHGPYPEHAGTVHRWLESGVLFPRHLHTQPIDLAEAHVRGEIANFGGTRLRFQALHPEMVGTEYLEETEL